MKVGEAIRKRRAVRNYTDTPVPDDVLDEILRLALAAPTGSGAQSWGLLVIRDADKRRALVDLVIAGAGRYFALMRHQKEDVSDEEHAAWGRDYAKQILASYHDVPVWVLAVLDPRRTYPAGMEEGGHTDDLLSVAFATQNLMLAARSHGLGTCPTTAFWRFELDALRDLLSIPAEVEPVVLTPIGHPTEFPKGRPPALRNFRRWETLVHDDSFGAVRAAAEG